jgi:flagellar hook-associated protein 3 FlgL
VLQRVRELAVAGSNGTFTPDDMKAIGVEINELLKEMVTIANETGQDGARIFAGDKAFTEPFRLVEGTNAHLIKVEDRQGSVTLQELGIISANNDPAAPNWHPSARVSGGSVFDMVIRLRDALFRGDQDFVGSQGIGGIDLALGNTLARVTELGSRMERAQATWERLNNEIPDTNYILARESGLDFAGAATDLSMMDFAHKAALQTAARIIPPTLLDFLR